jgi:enoyl-CoA hydratase/carnithine racemase
MSSSPNVEFSLRAKIGEVLLKRPEELNALTLSMIEAIDAQLADWTNDPNVTGVTLRGAGGQAFCAGIDQRALYQALSSGDREYGANFFRRFYRLLYRLGTFPKPTVAIMHGAAMGGGAALAMQCKIRVATRETYFAVPDCKLGYFPDGAMASALARCPGQVGTFLALTGVALRARGLVHANLATHLVPEDRIALVTPALVGQLAVTPTASPLADIEAHVNQLFGLSSPQEIMGILGVRGGEWAKATLDQLQPQSPTSLAVTFRRLRAAQGNAGGQSLEQALAADFRISQHLIDGHDFREGIRAYVIDRDQKPAWEPADPAAVTSGSIDAVFGPVAPIPEWTPAD